MTGHGIHEDDPADGQIDSHADGISGHHNLIDPFRKKTYLIHVCCSGTAENLLIRMIRRCGDTYDVVYHERNTKLEFVPRRYDMSSASSLRFSVPSNFMVFMKTIRRMSHAAL